MSTQTIGGSNASLGHHRVTIAAFEPVQMLDVTGPLEVLSEANFALQRNGLAPHYALTLAGMAAGPISTTNGIPLFGTRGMFDPDLAADTVLLSGGPGARAASLDPTLMARLNRLCQQVPRVGSICTGSFPLAATGLLDARGATTHWAYFDEFARLFPAVRLDRDALFVDDGKFHTSAGISAGIDSALAMIEGDLGRGIALDVARKLVVYLKRPGGQAQFSAELTAEAAAQDPNRFAALTQWISDHLTADLSVDKLADRVAMSPRNFARAFSDAMCQSPAKYVHSLRIDAARRLLTDGTLNVDRVAANCGFPSTEAMRVAFQRALNVAPSEFRERFRSSLARRSPEPLRRLG